MLETDIPKQMERKLGQLGHFTANAPSLPRHLYPVADEPADPWRRLAKRAGL
ncbi:hypothetical protein [Rhodophyticola porphyridii]|uniref:hypothetical protein n=1 Tax=Rhodophyticola porphyridii TaxID=1852017 RepID=UPI0035CFED23